MSWWAWLGLGMLWMTTVQWAYRKGQQQSIMLAANILEESRWNIGPALANRLRAEVDVKRRGPHWNETKNIW